MSRPRKQNVKRSNPSENIDSDHLPAKVTLPVVRGVHSRTRLLGLLERSRTRPIIWVGAPAGSGKTTLVADFLRSQQTRAIWYQLDASDGDPASFFYYLSLAVRAAAPKHRSAMPLLTAEYQAGTRTFSANFFREVFRRLGRDCVLVLDNYQDVPESAFHELLVSGCEQIPRGATLIVISREAPPGVFARARANDSMSMIDWEDMKLTEEESHSIVKVRCGGDPELLQSYKRLHAEALGWVAGIILLTEHRRSVTADRSVGSEATPQLLFDYFAHEIFHRADEPVRTFLMRTAFFPRLSVEVAATFEEQVSAETILQTLTDRNLFTVRHSGGHYEYHPLFRAFLIAQAKLHYGAEECTAIARRCADALAKNDRVEEAIALLQGNDARSALQLMLSQARTLVAQGRSQTLRDWLLSLPAELIRTVPWASYWLGAVSVAFAPAQARQHFEQAFALFEQEDDSSPLLLSWCGIIESFLLEWNDYPSFDAWFGRYDSLIVNRQPPRPEAVAAGVLIRFAALVQAHFDDGSLPTHAAQVERFLADQHANSQRLSRAGTLVRYYLWSGNIAGMKRLLETLATDPDELRARSPFEQISWYLYRSIYFGGTGDAVQAVGAAKDGLALAEGTGIHVFDIQLYAYGMFALLCSGRSAECRPLLAKMKLIKKAGRVGNFFISHYTALLHLHSGEGERAIVEAAHAESLVNGSDFFVVRISIPLLLAFTWVHRDTDDAMASTRTARVIANGAQSKLFRSYCDLAEANIHRVLGNRAACLDALQGWLAAAREMDVITPVWCLRADAAQLYNLALEAGVERSYVREVIVRTGLEPPPDCNLEHWPWAVSIRTMGSFQVLKEGAPLTFAGRAQKKPLEFLRALIALGGRDVPIAKIAKALWPHVGRESAKTALDTTLHRLRKLLGEKCILQQSGQLSLNERYCWLDVWSFDQLSDATADEIDPAIQRLFELYRGRFLPHDDQEWTRAERERCRLQFVRLLTHIASLLDSQGRDAEAASLHRRGAEVDASVARLYAHTSLTYNEVSSTN